MALSPEDEFKLKNKELELQRAQKRTTAVVTIVAALVALVASLGSQVIARTSGNWTTPRKEAFSLQIGLPLVGSANAGVYLFDANNGRMWIAQKAHGDTVSWLSVAPPSGP